MNNRKAWTIEDDQYLSETCNGRNITELAQRLGRSESATKTRYEQLKRPGHYAHARLSNNHEALARTTRTCDCSPGTLFSTQRCYNQHLKNSCHVIFELKKDNKYLRVENEMLKREVLFLRQERYYDTNDMVCG